MTPPITTSAPITPLKPTLRRIAQHLVDGLTTQDIATRTGLSANSIRQYIYEIRRSVHCPPRCKPPVLLHFLYTAQEAELPPADRPVPDLSPEQGRLLRAVAEHSKPRDIALAANIAPADVRSALNELLDKTGTADATQLVVLGHTWGLLGADTTGTVQS